MLSEIGPLLRQCTSFTHILQFHAFILRRGLHEDALILASFVHRASSLSFTRYALSLFDTARGPHIRLFNAIIRTLCATDFAGRAVSIFNTIQSSGLRPDTFSFPFVLRAVVKLGAIGLGRGIHGQVVRFGHGADVHVATGLVAMYSNCGHVADARKMFDEITVKDVVSWNAMMAGYVRFGDVESARELFEQMPERNVVS